MPRRASNWPPTMRVWRLRADRIARAPGTCWQEAVDLVERAITATGDDYYVYVSYLNTLHALGRTEALTPPADGRRKQSDT